uniref:Putative rab n=2 Tax=Amblyomma TaxID=6942 RepID=A0A023FGR0_AMBCJ
MDKNENAPRGFSDGEKEKDKLVENGKNKVPIECKYCSSRILNVGMSELVSTQYDLPTVDGDSKMVEKVTDFWCVNDIYTFENIGFSNTVGQTKYLACADCERGPLGWHSLETRKSFVALSRVRHL